MNAAPYLADMQRHGFPVGGESSIAVDLVDTITYSSTEAVVDLLERGHVVWWELESGRLPTTDEPGAWDTARLRSALRSAFKDRIDGVRLDADVVAELNSFAESVPTSSHLVRIDGVLRLETRWHSEFGGHPNLSAIARDGVALLADDSRSSRLRRCANPICSMIFVADNSKRMWCNPGICGNRARVARHYRKSQHDAHDLIRNGNR